LVPDEKVVACETEAGGLDGGFPVLSVLFGEVLPGLGVLAETVAEYELVVGRRFEGWGFGEPDGVVAAAGVAGVTAEIAGGAKA